jgi:hypothetical protein
MRNIEHDVSEDQSMSDLGRNNKAINSGLVEPTDKDKLLATPITSSYEIDPEKAAQRKKYIKIGLIVLGVVALILAIVLPIVLIKKDNPNPPRPDPIGPNPLPAGLMNPYKTDS